MNTEHLTSDQLIDYIHRELSPEDDAAILVHIESCAHCRADYEAEAKFSDALRAHAKLTERELPAGVIHRIWSAIDEPAAPSLRERLAAFLRPAVALPVAAIVALAIYFGAGANHGNVAQQTIDAAYYLDDHAALTRTVPFGEGNAVPSQLRNDQIGGSGEVVAVQSVVIRTADAAR